MASEAKHTPVTHDEAREIARRLIHGSFRRDGEQLEHDKRPRFSIPANPDRDDDLRICDYIEQQKAALAERDAALVAVEEAKKALEWIAEGKHATVNSFAKEAVKRARKALSSLPTAQVKHGTR